VRTDKTDKQTDANKRYTHAGGYTAGMGNDGGRWNERETKCPKK